MGKGIKIWYNSEGDYLEVIFERKAGYFRETENDAVMEKVDQEGNIIGFSILKVSSLKNRRPLSRRRPPQAPPRWQEPLLRVSVRSGRYTIALLPFYPFTLSARSAVVSI